jgi:hypothetical protein
MKSKVLYWIRMSPQLDPVLHHFNPFQLTSLHISWLKLLCVKHPQMHAICHTYLILLHLIAKIYLAESLNYEAAHNVNFSTFLLLAFCQFEIFTWTLRSYTLNLMYLCLETETNFHTHVKQQVTSYLYFVLWYCHAYGDYIRQGLDCKLDLSDPSTVHSITAYTLYNSQQLSH